MAGHPGTTQRLMTVAQLKTQLDVYLPFWLMRYSLHERNPEEFFENARARDVVGDQTLRLARVTESPMRTC